MWEKGELGGNRWCLVSTYLKKKLPEAEITFHQNTTVRTTPSSFAQMHTSGSKNRAQTLLQTNRWCCRIIPRTWGIVGRALQNVRGEVDVFPNFYSPPLTFSSNFTRWTWFSWEPLAFKAFRGWADLQGEKCCKNLWGLRLQTFYLEASFNIGMSDTASKSFIPGGL